MTCPKCGGPMRQYERNGVVLDQCTDCRGLFLDRGELERLIDAEQAWSSAPPPAPHEYATQTYAAPAYGYGGHTYHRKRESFLSELFDD